MKKLLSLALVSFMALSLAACGSGKKEADLKISGLNGGYGTKGWEKVVEAFKKANDVDVELTMEKNIADTLRPVLTSGKDVPDLVYLSIGAEGGLTDTMVSEKQILDISDVLKEKAGSEDTTVADKLIGGMTESLTASPYADGKLYLAPINYGPCGLFYNAGLFKEKGWEVPTTWDEMWALGDKAAAEGIALFTYPTTGYFDAFFSALLNETAGPEVYAKLMNYDSEAWALPEVKQAFEIVGKLANYTEANTVANANKEGFTKNQQLILDNKALFVPNGTWLPGEMEEAPRADGFEWGFTALPKVSADGDAYSTTFTEQMWVPSKAKNADLAKKFIAFCYSDEAAKIFYENGGAVMPIKTASSMMDDKDANKLYYSVYDNGAKANAVGFAATEAIEGVDLTSAEGILYNTVNEVVNKTKSVDDWYNAVIEAVKKYDK
ncbi:MAG: carbohydrate ABC transporter substrate-binding protein [Erysipelotrichia bacterium]|nr:carbohydrate ABC transporter substrate-binding protein [Erysipelotrichia bacterium]NCC54181.1 carbohydrate ABC transporter substrate-binding protein [Erysipelotrichia bacterium]